MSSEQLSDYNGNINPHETERCMIIVVADTVEYTDTLLYWYLLLPGEIQVVLDLGSSSQCDSLNVSTQHS